jgi:hypothetical protein
MRRLLSGALLFALVPLSHCAETPEPKAPEPEKSKRIVLSSKDQKESDDTVEEEERGPQGSGPDAEGGSRWTLPPAVESIASNQFVAYVPPGEYCAPGMTKNAQGLASFLRSRFDWIRKVGGYSCRVNSADRYALSMHSSGRAVDVHVPFNSKGNANQELGDAVANYLVTRAEAFGVQLVIWRRSEWKASRETPKLKEYKGKSPHLDHIHVELKE